MTARIADPDPSSGLERAEWQLFWAESGIWQTIPLKLKGGPIETAVLRVPAGFKGWMKIKAWDAEGNSLEIPSGPAGIVLESPSFHSLEEHVKIQRPETGYRDAEGREYICVTGTAYSSWRAIYDHVDLYSKYCN